MLKYCTENVFYLFDLDKYKTEKSLWIKHHIYKSIFNIRLCYILGLVLYCLFAILDVYMAPITYKSIWVIRFVVVVPVLFSLYLVTFSKYFIRFNQIITLLFVSFAAGGIILMIYISKPIEPAHRYYYAGLMLVFVAQNGLTHLKAELGFIYGIIMVIIYDVTTIDHFTDAQEIATNLNNNFFLISSSILGFAGAKTTEYLFRRDYFQTKKLIESNMKLDELNAVKTKFLSILSHDLRSPIVNVKSLIFLLKNAYISKEEFQSKLDTLLQSVNGANTLLDNLLAWSSTHFHSGQLRKKPVSLKLLTDNVCEVMNPLAIQKEINLVNAIDEKIRITVEPSLLETVIRNLVSNAIKFTEKGQIKISAESQDANVKVNIEDTGIGMPESILNNLFNWETKSSSRGTQNERGAGIGLLISKEFVEMHQGRIFVKSVLGKGTIFSFTISLN